MPSESPVLELRLALTVDDYDKAVAFWHDALGLPVDHAFGEGDERGVVLDAGKATIEILSRRQAELVDQIEVGRNVGAPVRLALEVADSVAAADTLAASGAEMLAKPVETPWRHRNVRLRSPEGLQLTLFTLLDGSDHPAK